eukprot:gene12736-46_t
MFVVRVVVVVSNRPSGCGSQFVRNQHLQLQLPTVYLPRTHTLSTATPRNRNRTGCSLVTSRFEKQMYAPNPALTSVVRFGPPCSCPLRGDWSLREVPPAVKQQMDMLQKALMEKEQVRKKLDEELKGTKGELQAAQAALDQRTAMLTQQAEKHRTELMEAQNAAQAAAGSADKEAELRREVAALQNQKLWDKNQQVQSLEKRALQAEQNAQDKIRSAEAEFSRKLQAAQLVERRPSASPPRSPRSDKQVAELQAELHASRQQLKEVQAELKKSQKSGSRSPRNTDKAKQAVADTVKELEAALELESAQERLEEDMGELRLRAQSAENREKKLKRQMAELANTQKDVVKQKKQMEKRLAALMERETDMDMRDEMQQEQQRFGNLFSLVEKAEMAEKEAAIKERERALKKKQANMSRSLKRKEGELDNKIDELDSKEAELELKEMELGSKEEVVESAASQLKRQAEATAQEKKALEEVRRQVEQEKAAFDLSKERTQAEWKAHVKKQQEELGSLKEKMVKQQHAQQVQLAAEKQKVEASRDQAVNQKKQLLKQSAVLEIMRQKSEALKADNDKKSKQLNSQKAGLEVRELEDAEMEKELEEKKKALAMRLKDIARIHEAKDQEMQRKQDTLDFQQAKSKEDLKAVFQRKDQEVQQLRAVVEKQQQAMLAEFTRKEKELMKKEAMVARSRKQMREAAGAGKELTSGAGPGPDELVARERALETKAAMLAKKEKILRDNSELSEARRAQLYELDQAILEEEEKVQNAKKAVARSARKVEDARSTSEANLEAKQRHREAEFAVKLSRLYAAEEEMKEREAELREREAQAAGHDKAARTEKVAAAEARQAYERKQSRLRDKEKRLEARRREFDAKRKKELGMNAATANLETEWADMMLAALSADPYSGDTKPVRHASFRQSSDMSNSLSPNAENRSRSASFASHRLSVASISSVERLRIAILSEVDDSTTEEAAKEQALLAHESRLVQLEAQYDVQPAPGPKKYPANLSRKARIADRSKDLRVRVERLARKASSSSPQSPHASPVKGIRQASPEEMAAWEERLLAKERELEKLRTSHNLAQQRICTTESQLRAASELIEQREAELKRGSKMDEASKAMLLEAFSALENLQVEPGASPAQQEALAKEKARLRKVKRELEDKSKAQAVDLQAREAALKLKSETLQSAFGLLNEQLDQAAALTEALEEEQAETARRRPSNSMSRSSSSHSLQRSGSRSSMKGSSPTKGRSRSSSSKRNSSPDAGRDNEKFKQQLVERDRKVRKKEENIQKMMAAHKQFEAANKDQQTELNKKAQMLAMKEQTLAQAMEMFVDMDAQIEQLTAGSAKLPAKDKARLDAERAKLRKMRQHMDDKAKVQQSDMDRKAALLRQKAQVLGQAFMAIETDLGHNQPAEPSTPDPDLVAKLEQEVEKYKSRYSKARTFLSKASRHSKDLQAELRKAGVDAKKQKQLLDTNSTMLTEALSLLDEEEASVSSSRSPPKALQDDQGLAKLEKELARYKTKYSKAKMAFAKVNSSSKKLHADLQAASGDSAKQRKLLEANASMLAEAMALLEEEDQGGNILSPRTSRGNDGYAKLEKELARYKNKYSKAKIAFAKVNSGSKKLHADLQAASGDSAKQRKLLEANASMLAEAMALLEQDDSNEVHISSRTESPDVEDTSAKDVRLKEKERALRRKEDSIKSMMGAHRQFEAAHKSPPVIFSSAYVPAAFCPLQLDSVWPAACAFSREQQDELNKKAQMLAMKEQTLAQAMEVFGDMDAQIEQLTAGSAKLPAKDKARLDAERTRIRKLKRELEDKGRGQDAAFLAKEQALAQKQAALQAAFAAMQDMDADMMALVEDSATATPDSPVALLPAEPVDAARLEQRERRVKKKEEQVRRMLAAHKQFEQAHHDRQVEAERKAQMLASKEQALAQAMDMFGDMDSQVEQLTAGSVKLSGADRDKLDKERARLRRLKKDLEDKSKEQEQEVAAKGKALEQKAQLLQNAFAQLQTMDEDTMALMSAGDAHGSGMDPSADNKTAAAQEELQREKDELRHERARLAKAKRVLRASFEQINSLEEDLLAGAAGAEEKERAMVQRERALMDAFEELNDIVETETNRSTSNSPPSTPGGSRPGSKMGSTRASGLSRKLRAKEKALKAAATAHSELEEAVRQRELEVAKEREHLAKKEAVLQNAMSMFGDMDKELEAAMASSIGSPRRMDKGQQEKIARERAKLRKMKRDLEEEAVRHREDLEAKQKAVQSQTESLRQALETLEEDGGEAVSRATSRSGDLKSLADMFSNLDYPDAGAKSEDMLKLRKENESLQEKLNEMKKKEKVLLRREGAISKALRVADTFQAEAEATKQGFANRDHIRQQTSAALDSSLTKIVDPRLASGDTEGAQAVIKEEQKRIRHLQAETRSGDALRQSELDKKAALLVMREDALRQAFELIREEIALEELDVGKREALQHELANLASMKKDFQVTEANRQANELARRSELDLREDQLAEAEARLNAVDEKRLSVQDKEVHRGRRAQLRADKQILREERATLDQQIRKGNDEAQGKKRIHDLREQAVRKGFKKDDESTKKNNINSTVAAGQIGLDVPPGVWQAVEEERKCLADLQHALKAKEGMLHQLMLDLDGLEGLCVEEGQTQFETLMAEWRSKMKEDAARTERTAGELVQANSKLSMALPRPGSAGPPSGRPLDMDSQARSHLLKQILEERAEQTKLVSPLTLSLVSGDTLKSQALEQKLHDLIQRESNLTHQLAQADVKTRELQEQKRLLDIREVSLRDAYRELEASDHTGKKRAQVTAMLTATIEEKAAVEGELAPAKVEREAILADQETALIEQERALATRIVEEAVAPRLFEEEYLGQKEADLRSREARVARTRAAYDGMAVLGAPQDTQVTSVPSEQLEKLQTELSIHRTAADSEKQRLLGELEKAGQSLRAREQQLLEKQTEIGSISVKLFHLCNAEEDVQELVDRGCPAAVRAVDLHIRNLMYKDKEQAERIKSLQIDLDLLPSRLEALSKREAEINEDYEYRDKQLRMWEEDIANKEMQAHGLIEEADKTKKDRETKDRELRAKEDELSRREKISYEMSITKAAELEEKEAMLTKRLEEVAKKGKKAEEALCDLQIREEEFGRQKKKLDSREAGLRERAHKAGTLEKSVEVGGATWRERERQLAQSRKSCEEVAKKGKKAEEALCDLQIREEEFGRQKKKLDSREAGLRERAHKAGTLEKSVEARERMVGHRERQLAQSRKSCEEDRRNIALSQAALQDRESELTRLAQEKNKEKNPTVNRALLQKEPGSGAAAPGDAALTAMEKRERGFSLRLGAAGKQWREGFAWTEHDEDELYDVAELSEGVSFMNEVLDSTLLLQQEALVNRKSRLFFQVYGDHNESMGAHLPFLEYGDQVHLGLTYVRELDLQKILLFWRKAIHNCPFGAPHKMTDMALLRSAETWWSDVKDMWHGVHQEILGMRNVALDSSLRILHSMRDFLPPRADQLLPESAATENAHTPGFKLKARKIFSAPSVKFGPSHFTPGEVASRDLALQYGVELPELAASTSKTTSGTPTLCRTLTNPPDTV